VVERARAQARRAARRLHGRVLGGHGREGPALTTLAYIGIGSNLGDREEIIRRAAALIGARRLSSIVETEPWGYEEQPRFLNAVAEVEPPLEPRPFLGLLLDIERSLGRERVGPRWGPRTIDLDLLLYGDRVVAEPGLTLPHPHLHERLFVLTPLAELAPDLVVPGRGPVEALLAGIDSGA
jgi:2-amino-4-hydroxy-6-hydroxymethyldihydropteridine diphosphokinase